MILLRQWTKTLELQSACQQCGMMMNGAELPRVVPVKLRGKKLGEIEAILNSRNAHFSNVAHYFRGEVFTAVWKLVNSTFKITHGKDSPFSYIL